MVSVKNRLIINIFCSEISAIICQREHENKRLKEFQDVFNVAFSETPFLRSVFNFDQVDSNSSFFRNKEMVVQLRDIKVM